MDSANADFTFSNVSYTADSVTFTINGDMSGYAIPDNGVIQQFSLLYGGDIWNGSTANSPNTWSRFVFDNKTISVSGNTLNDGNAIDPGKLYSFSIYDSSLNNALVSNATVTLSLGGKRLLTDAASPTISFYWGNANKSTIANSTLLATVIPVPDSTTPALTMVKSSDVATYSAVDDVINYSYMVTSSGTGPVAGPIAVDDDKVSVSCPPVSAVGNKDDNLDPAEALTCTASHTVAQADIDATSITNTAVASGGDGTDSNMEKLTVNYLSIFKDGFEGQ